MESIQIETTQNVTLEYTPASVGDRILAYLIDSLIIIAWMIMFIFIGVGLGINSRSNSAPFVVLFVIGFLPLMFYNLVSELLMNGQTVGKKAMNIRVVMVDGSQPTVGAYLIRWIMRLIDIQLMSGVVAIIAIASNNRGQRLGDMAANTTVVKLRPPVGLSQIMPPATATEHRVSFPEVTMLTDRDISVVRAVLNKNTSENQELLHQAALKIKQVTGIQSAMEPMVFLQTILKDYTHLMYKDYTQS